MKKLIPQNKSLVAIKRLGCLLVFLSGIITALHAQKPTEVLENGIKVGERDKLILDPGVTGQYEGKILYDLWSTNSADFKYLEDSAIFVVPKGTMTVFVRPLNPLNFSYNASVEFTIDEIEKQASDVLANIISTLPKSGSGSPSAFHTISCDDLFNKLADTLTVLQNLLKEDKKPEIQNLFKRLKALDFKYEASTGKLIKKIDEDRKPLIAIYADLQSRIDQFKKQIEAFACDSLRESFTIRQLFANIVTELRKEYANKFKRLENLNEAFVKVKEVFDEASVEKEGMDWVTEVVSKIPIKRGQIAVLTIIVNQSGLTMNDDYEIVVMKTKEKTRRTMHFRKFNRIIPEVSAGTAFAAISFPNYSTRSDENGQHYVAQGADEAFRKFNVTTMLNLNYFITHSAVHPFFQIGAGLNAGYPTLFTGVGLRLNFLPVKRMAVAVGYASSWVKTLNTLKIDDKVDGEAALENDISYEFRWPLKPYVGIQVNF